MAAATVDVVIGDDDGAAFAVGCDGGKNKWGFYHQLSECTAAVECDDVAVVAIAAAGSDDCDRQLLCKLLRSTAAADGDEFVVVAVAVVDGGFVVDVVANGD